MKRIGVLLSGCGVFDGAEIQESVFTLLAIDQNGGKAVCVAPNINQHHVVNHINGDEMPENRNVLTEAARIARGNIQDLAKISSNDFDALVIPGGFGDAKNLTKWAFSGANGEINSDVKRIINEMLADCKPIVGLCMGPTVIAKALEGKLDGGVLTVGNNTDQSPYDIAEVQGEIKKLGFSTKENKITEITIDKKNKIITAPCYMMEVSISQVYDNAKQAIDELFRMM